MISYGNNDDKAISLVKSKKKKKKKWLQLFQKRDSDAEKRDSGCLKFLESTIA